MDYFCCSSRCFLSMFMMTSLIEVHEVTEACNYFIGLFCKDGDQQKLLLWSLLGRIIQVHQWKCMSLNPKCRLFKWEVLPSLLKKKSRNETLRKTHLMPFQFHLFYFYLMISKQKMDLFILSVQGWEFSQSNLFADQERKGTMWQAPWALAGFFLRTSGKC